MDQIFVQNPSILVCGKPDLTRRERPQAFMDAETRRIAEAENSRVGKEAVLEGEAQHVEAHHERV